MHKSIDLGYHLLESQLIYPSLMSPLKSIYSTKALSPNKKSIFERLQADTELRLRAKHDSRSPPKTLRNSSTQKIEDVLLRKGKEREIRKRQLIEKEEIRKINELQEKPTINPFSQVILNNKNKSYERLAKEFKNSQEKDLNFSINLKESNEANFEAKKKGDDEKKEENRKSIQSSQRISLGNKSEAELNLSSSQRVLIKELEKRYKYLSKKNNKDEDQQNSKVRKYVPMFTKPIEIDRLIQRKGLNKQCLIYSGKSPKILQSDNKRPQVRPISDCTVKISDAYSYQQIIQNRLLRQSESFLKSTKKHF